jgi:hypothetical protein
LFSLSESTQALSDAVLPLLPQAFQLVQRHEFNHTVIAILEALTLKTQGTNGPFASACLQPFAAACDTHSVV